MTQDLDLILNPSSHIEVLRDFPPKSFAFGAKLPALFAKFHSFRQKQENINCCQGERTIQQRTSKLPWVKVQYFDEGVKRYSIFIENLELKIILLLFWGVLAKIYAMYIVLIYNVQMAAAAVISPLYLKKVTMKFKHK